MTDTLDTEQSELRDLLISKGWKRDARCKKYETYKQTFGYTVIKFEFRHRSVFIAKFTSRKSWRGIDYFSYINTINRFGDIIVALERDYGSPESGETLQVDIPVDERETRQDRQERDEYFRRLGI